MRMFRTYAGPRAQAADPDTVAQAIHGHCPKRSPRNTRPPERMTRVNTHQAGARSAAAKADHCAGNP